MEQAPSSKSEEHKASVPAAALHSANAAKTSTSETCPVDHKSREIWLQQGAVHGKATENNSTPQTTQSEERSWLSFLWSSSGAPPSPNTIPTSPRLRTDREISSIPRAYSDGPASASPVPPTNSSSTTSSCASTPTPSALTSPYSQTSDPHTSPEGNWIYPSEEMFFNAMRRKSYKPRAADMSSVIPIHNAVNEKTWRDILAWENGAAPRSTLACGGPKLVSFSGNSQKLTPRARWNVLLGYEKPFDRHDWLVDRCGKKIEYVIDFYAGKRRDGDNKGPSFYLDVRPKLNSWEGCRMRAARAIGWNS